MHTTPAEWVLKSWEQLSFETIVNGFVRPGFIKNITDIIEQDNEVGIIDDPAITSLLIAITS